MIRMNIFVIYIRDMQLCTFSCSREWPDENEEVSVDKYCEGTLSTEKGRG